MVAESEYKHDARRLFEIGKKATGKKQITLTTDGLPAYHDAYKIVMACMHANARLSTETLQGEELTYDFTEPKSGIFFKLNP